MSIQHAKPCEASDHPLTDCGVRREPPWLCKGDVHR